jgi:hypothetical protein
VNLRLIDVTGGQGKRRATKVAVQPASVEIRIAERLVGIT